MSFLDNTKTAGTALWIVGILMIISALLSIVCGFVDDDMKDHSVGYAIMGIGALICAFVYFGFGKSIRSGNLSDKFGIVTKFVYVVGLVTVITGIFTAISGVGFDDIATYIVSGIIIVILGLIVMWIYRKITDDSITTFDRVMWIILLVIFIILFILTVASIFTVSGSGLELAVNVINAICDFVIYLFMIAFLLNSDVKAKFGM